MGYAIANTNFEVALAVVDKEDVYDASIVSVDDTGADIDGKLARQATTRSHATISSRGNCDRELSVD